MVIFTVIVSSIVEAENPWKLSRQKDGIVVYVRDTPNSKLKSFKGVVTIPVRLTALVAALQDTKAFPRLFHNCKNARSLKKVGKNESYNYVVTNMPWPVKDRDSIVHSVLKQDKKTKRIRISINSKPKMLAVNKKMVRIQQMSGSWEFIPLKSGNVKVTYELSIMPGGKLPIWLVNVLAVDFPFYTLKNIRELVKTPVYMNAKRSYIID